MKSFGIAVSLLSIALGAMAQEAPRAGTGLDMPVPTSERTPQSGYLFTPESSKEQPAGRLHTTYVLRSLDGNKPVVVNTPISMSSIAPTGTVEEAETPQSLGC